VDDTSIAFERDKVADPWRSAGSGKISQRAGYGIGRGSPGLRGVAGSIAGK